MQRNAGILYLLLHVCIKSSVRDDLIHITQCTQLYQTCFAKLAGICKDYCPVRDLTHLLLHSCFTRSLIRQSNRWMDTAD